MSQTATDISKILGEFWTRIWKEPKLVDGMTQGLARPFDQLDMQADEAQSYLSRFDMPLTFFRHWEVFDINEEDLVPEVVKIGEITIGAFKIGGEKLPRRWKTAKDMENCSLLLSSPINPSTVWTKGQEFTIKDGNLIFYKDPFSFFDVSVVISADGGPLKKCRVWLSSTETDMDALKTHFGVYFNLNVPSTLFYQRIVNNVWDLRVQGATSLNIRKLLGSIADSEVCEADGAVTDVWTENGRAWVAVDSRLYSAADPSAATVSAGDAVLAGDLLFDTFSMYRIGDSIAATDIPAIQLDSGLLSSTYEGGLLFENRTFDLEYIYASGRDDVTVLTQDMGTDYLLVSTINGIQNVNVNDTADLATWGIIKLPIFPIGGAEGSIKQYRADMAAKAFTLGIDVWEAVTRGQRNPYTINPFEFLRTNVFGSNMFFVKYKEGAISLAAPLQASVRQLVDCVPAGSTFLIFLETGSTLVETLSDTAADEQEEVSLTGEMTEAPVLVKSEKIYTSNAIF